MPHSSDNRRDWIAFALKVVTGLAALGLAIGLIQLFIGVVFHGWEGTAQLILLGGPVSLISGATLLAAKLLRRKLCASEPLGDTAAGRIATQPHGEIFPWPRGTLLTAVDEVVLALPTALLESDRPISEFVFGPDDMEISIPPGSETFFIRLTPGMSISLTKSVQASVVSEDLAPRRIQVNGS